MPRKRMEHSCIDCGKVSLVAFRKGQPKTLRCPSCARKKPQYYQIKEHYEIGDTLNGSLCNKNPAHTYILKKCHDCNTTQWVNLREAKNDWHCRRCAAKSVWYKNPLNGLDMSGDKHPFWKGGRYENYFGYIQMRLDKDDPLQCMAVSNGYVLEHRYIMAKFLGRPLSSDELVHHKNGIKDDNRIENLELTKQGRHIKEHSKGYTDGFNKGYVDGLNAGMQILDIFSTSNIKVSQEDFKGKGSSVG